MLAKLFVKFCQFGLACFTADLIIAGQNVNKLPTTNLYIEICWKSINNAVNLMSSLPGGKLVLGGITVLVAKDIGMLNYITNKTSQMIDSHYKELVCRDCVEVEEPLLMGNHSIQTIAGEDTLEQ